MHARVPARATEPPLHARRGIAALVLLSLLSALLAPVGVMRPSLDAVPVPVADAPGDLRALHEAHADRARRVEVTRVPARAVAPKTVPKATAKKAPVKRAEPKRSARAKRVETVRLPSFNVSTSASAAVRRAMSVLGRPYRYGAAGPSSFDCSGLLVWVWAYLGVHLPHKAAALYGVGRPVPRSQVRAGDILILNGGGHAALAISATLMIHAPHTGDHVRIAKISGFSAARRLL